MKIAITSANATTISGHAGKCPGYLLFTLNDQKIVHKEHIKLKKEQVFKNFSGPLSINTDHPLHGINTFITQSLGDGLKQRLSQDSIKTYTTEISDPEEAIKEIIGAFYSKE